MSTDNTVIDFEQWKQWTLSEYTSITPDSELAEFFNKYFTGYMTDPVALYDGKAIVARVISFNAKDQKELEQHLESLSAQGELFLYTIEHYTSTAHWRLRYALLNDEKLI
jgi:hypothetical protein